MRDEIVCDETNLRKERKGRGRMTERNGAVKWRFVSDRRRKKKKRPELKKKKKRDTTNAETSGSQKQRAVCVRT